MAWNTGARRPDPPCQLLLAPPGFRCYHSVLPARRPSAPPGRRGPMHCQPRCVRRPTRYLPCLESLEDRCLLAASASVSGSTLLVIGTDRPDRVQIVDNGTSLVNNVEAVVNRVVFTPGVAITNIIARTHGGNDSVVYTLTGP